MNVKLSNCDENMLCDLPDWERMKQYTWFKDAYGYAGTNCACNRTAANKTIKYHLMMLGTREGLVVDHINRNRLDNRRVNLRFITQHANCMNRNLNKNNTSGHSGVSYRKDTKMWKSSITVGYKTIALGCYADKEDAINARLMAEERYFAPHLEAGEFV